MEDDDLLQPLHLEEEGSDEPNDDGQPSEEPQLKVEIPAEPVKEEPKEQTVPLAALQAEREEKRGLKARLEQFERQLAQLTQAPQPTLQDDPAAYLQSLETRFSQREANLVAEMSERMTRASHGDALVDEAFAAAEAAGALDQFKGKKDAWGDLVKWHKTQKAAKEIGDDPAAFKARLREQIMAEMAAERASSPASQPAPSLAGETNLGARTAPAWNGPTPLDDILGGKGSSF